MNEDDLELWGDARARGSDPDTSHEAAASMAGEPAGALQMAIAALLHSQLPHGLICSEICAALAVQWNSISPRLKPMRRKKIIHDTGLRRPGPSNRQQMVLKWGPPPPTT